MKLLHWLIAGEWRAHPLRAALAVIAIAVGVALGFAIDLINGAAFNEFTAAIKSISGQADLQVKGVETSFDENLFPQLVRHADVQMAMKCSTVWSFSLHLLTFWIASTLIQSLSGPPQQ